MWLFIWRVLNLYFVIEVHYLRVSWFYTREDIERVKPKGINQLDRLFIISYQLDWLRVFTYVFLTRFLKYTSKQELYASDHQDLIESSEIACESEIYLLIVLYNDL